MSMTISIDTLRKALRDTNAKAAVAFADAEKLKDGMIAAGVDPTEAEHFEKVDTAYKGYSVLADEAAQMEAKLNRLLEIEGISGKAPVGEPKRPLAGDPERKDGSPVAFGGRGRAADRLLASEGYKQLKGSGILEMSDARVATAPVKVLERTEFKTLITGLADTQAGAFILADRQTELLELLRRPRVVAGLVNVGDTDSDMIEYVEQTSRTNNAAEVAEATSSADGAAPESGVAFAVRQVLVQEIKHFIPATKRAIADAGQVRAIIESELVEGVLERLDGQLLSGNGTAPNLRGIYNTSGISTQANGTDSRSDAVHKSFTLIRIANLQPDSLGLHPNDAQDLRLEKDANGAYLFGPPSQAGGDQVWGVPMVSNVAFTDGTPLAGAYRRGASLWIREGVSMSMTDAHSDWFIRGIVALLASMRAGFAVPRPAAFCTVTGFWAMSDVTGNREFVAFGDQGQRPPDPQPERVLMVAPDGRAVQVMTEDVAGFEERGFVLETPAVTERLAAASALATALLDGLRQVLSSTAGFAGDVASAVLQAVKAVVNGVIDQLNRTLEFTIKMPGPVPDVHVNPPDIPHLARGGIVIAGDNPSGIEAVVPLERAREFGFGGTAAGGEVHQHIHFNGFVGNVDELLRQLQLAAQRAGRSGVFA